MFRLLRAELAGPQELVLTWSSVAGKNYRVLGKGSFAELEWVNVGPIIPSAGATTTSTNVITSISPQLIYRVGLAP